MSIERRSRHTDRDWRDMRAQVRRWHQRLEKVPAMAVYDKAAALDFVDAFFMTCFHLKDWVKKSQLVPQADSVERYINDHQELELCRELCHATKHFELDSGSTMRTDAQRVFINGVEQPNERWIVVDDDGREWEMFALASRCVDLWEAFLPAD